VHDESGRPAGAEATPPDDGSRQGRAQEVSAPYSNGPITTLEELLDRLRDTARKVDPVSVSDILATTGRRSFGLLLLVPGIIVLSPLSGIPGLPSMFAIIVLLIAVQLLLRRPYVWLPEWLLRRRVPSHRMKQALHVLRPMARLIDRVIRPRLTQLTRGIALYAVAALCVVIAVTMPPLELIPFANSMAGAVLTTFGVALIGHDGVVVIIALALCVAAAWVIVSGLM
jgi:hypothetical protein